MTLAAGADGAASRHSRSPATRSSRRPCSRSPLRRRRLNDGRRSASGRDASSTARPSPADLRAASPRRSRAVSARRDAGPRGGARRRGPGEPGLRPQQGPRRPSRPACAPSTTRCRPTTREAELLALIARLNADPAVDGILVQLPLPPQIDAQKVIEAIDPAKDVDGFHPVNAGRLADRRAGLRALHAARLPAPRSRSVRPDLAGLEAVVVGRSNIVGKPMAQLLLARELHRDHGPFANAATCRTSAGAPTSWSPRSAGRNDARRLDQARRHRDRRRHQPRAGPRRRGRQDPARRRRGLRRGAGGRRARSRRCRAASGR